MRRAAAVLLLALTACSQGVQRGATPAPSPSPSATTATTTPSATATPTPSARTTASGALLAYTDLDGEIYLRDVSGTTVRTGVTAPDANGLWWAGPYLYWQDAEGAHRLDPTTAEVSDVDVGDDRIIATRGDDLLVADGSEGSGSGGGPEIVFEVTPEGKRTRLFMDGDDADEGDVRNLTIRAATVTGDGKRLVYSGGATSGRECEIYLFVTSWDFTTKHDAPVQTPVLEKDSFNAPFLAATGLDGRTFLSVKTKVGGCPTKSDRSAVYVLRGTTWVKFREGAEWASTGPNGEVALLRPNALLLVDGKVVAKGVTHAAWGTTLTD